MQQLRDAGVELAEYCRPRWWNLRRFNHRTHRKLLIVDGAIGYTFGHGIADQWLGDGEDEDHWRDTAVRLEGPVAGALQSVFMENWIEETHCVPAGDGCYPRLEHKGDVAAHVVSSASEEVGSKVALLYTVAIASARKEVIIQNPYFAPDDGVCELFAKMVKRGVAVHLMVPGRKTDSPFVRIAGSHLYRTLLEAGVRVYEFEPTLPHQKIVIVDRIWSHVGSTNFDARSLALNEEVGVGILDEQIASGTAGSVQSRLAAQLGIAAGALAPAAATGARLQLARLSTALSVVANQRILWERLRLGRARCDVQRLQRFLRAQPFAEHIDAHPAAAGKAEDRRFAADRAQVPCNRRSSNCGASSSRSVFVSNTRSAARNIAGSRCGRSSPSGTDSSATL